MIVRLAILLKAIAADATYICIFYIRYAITCAICIKGFQLVNVVVLSALIGVTPPFIVALEPKSILSKASITAAEAPVPSSNNNLALPLLH